MRSVLRPWQLLPAQFRSRIRSLVHSLKAFGGWACLWRWRFASIPSTRGDTVFMGRESSAEEAAALLGTGAPARIGLSVALDGLRSGHAAIVSEAYVPGAIRAQRHVRMIFPTHSGRMKLAGRRRALAAEHLIRRAQGDAEVERAYRDFLVPFALNRHGPGAANLTLANVKRLAEYGRLDILMFGNAQVGAHLGFPAVIANQRYWVGCRVGYPREVYEDSRRLADCNAINFFLQLRKAEETGFDFYDMGESPARPEGGLLQFKKRMGGVLAAGPSYDSFWIRPPSGEAPAMLWDAPLFSLERQGMVLNLGVPEGLRELEAVERCRDIAFEGLAAVRLHTGGQVPESILGVLKCCFDGIPLEIAAGRGDPPYPGR